MPTLTFLFGLREQVTRRPFILFGLGLAVVKIALDSAVVYTFSHRLWSPLGYIVPSLILREEGSLSAPNAEYAVLPLVALPFLWIGLSMCVRRAADAGISPWLGLLFAIPLFNYVVIAVLCTLPTRHQPKWNWNTLPPQPSSDTLGVARITMLAALASTGLGVCMLAFSVYGLRSYGSALFFATPLAMGALSAAIFNRETTQSAFSTLVVAWVGVMLPGLLFLFFAIEGIFCLAMAAPIALAIAALGALVGREVMIRTRTHLRSAGALMLVLPGLAVGEAHVAKPQLRDVTTSIEIDATPERVWPHVVGFSDLDEPPQWFFKLGIAYPKRATIQGQGVGALRKCEFSTGPFVEPITAWDSPRRLAFDVAAQPPSMTEWSPFGAINAPHLEGYMVSRGGEFDLVPLPGGRTRLEGTTHYTLAIYPEAYWTPYAEALLHAIHSRVLEHIKHLTEADPDRNP